MQRVVFNAHYLAYCDDALGRVVPQPRRWRWRTTGGR